MIFLVFSDSHFNTTEMEILIKKIPHNRIIFLGDMQRDIEHIQRTFPNESICSVLGNNDYALNQAEYEKVLFYESFKILCCHGHKYRAKMTLDNLYYISKKNNINLALFGHTHKSLAIEKEGVLLLNPGSIGYKSEFAIVEIHDGNIRYKLCRYDKDSDIIHYNVCNWRLRIYENGAKPKISFAPYVFYIILRLNRQYA